MGDGLVAGRAYLAVRRTPWMHDYRLRRAHGRTITGRRRGPYVARPIHASDCAASFAIAVLAVSSATTDTAQQITFFVSAATIQGTGHRLESLRKFAVAEDGRQATSFESPVRGREAHGPRGQRFRDGPNPVAIPVRPESAVAALPSGRRGVASDLAPQPRWLVRPTADNRRSSRGESTGSGRIGRR